MSTAHDEMMRELLLRPCKDKRALKNWIKTFLDVELFDTIVSRFADSSPLDAAWEVYSFAMFPKGRMPENFLFASARNTQKTLVTSALAFMMAIHAKRQHGHFAAALEQLKPAREYISNFVHRPYIRDLLKTKVTADRATFCIPNDHADPRWVQEGTPTAEIFDKDPLSCREVFVEFNGISASYVQGKHYPSISADEIAMLKGEKVAFYKDLRKIPTASHDGKPYVTFKISTRRGAFSVVEKEIEESKKTGLRVRRWTVFEGVEYCRDDRSGTDWTHERFASTSSPEVITEDQLKHLDDKKQRDYEKVILASGCLTCPLAAVCRGDLKKQKCKSRWLQPIETAISEYVGSDLAFYNSQCLSLMPSREGQVFPTFDESIHMVDPDFMYEIFTGQKPEQPQNSVTLAKLFRRHGLQAGLGLDWGFQHPLAMSLHFYKDDRVYTVMAMAKSGMELDRHVLPYLRELQRIYGKFKIFPDIARPDLNTTVAREFDVFDSKDKDVDASVRIMRQKLRPNRGAPQWFLLKEECKSLGESLKRYHYEENTDGTYSDKIDKVEDDDVDAARYFFYGAFEDNGGVQLAADSPRDQAATDPNLSEEQRIQRMNATAIYRTANLPDPIPTEGAAISVENGVMTARSGSFSFVTDLPEDDSDF